MRQCQCGNSILLSLKRKRPGKEIKFGLLDYGAWVSGERGGCKRRHEPP